MQRKRSIKALRKTRAGDLVELRQSLTTTDLHIILGVNVAICVLKAKSTMEMTDLDNLMTKEEVNVDVNAVLGAPAKFKTLVSKENSQGQNKTIHTLGVKDSKVSGYKVLENWIGELSGVRKA